MAKLRVTDTAPHDHETSNNLNDTANIALTARRGSEP